MRYRVSGRPVSARRGFTLIELLVAMATILFIMVIVSRSFVEGTETFRNLKASGDMADRLRTAATILRKNLLDAHFSTDEFIRDTLRIGSADPAEADTLQAEFEAIYAEAADIETLLGEAERETVNPVGRRYLKQLFAHVDVVKKRAVQMIHLLECVKRFG